MSSPDSDRPRRARGGKRAAEKPPSRLRRTAKPQGRPQRARHPWLEEQAAPPAPPSPEPTEPPSPEPPPPEPPSTEPTEPRWSRKDEVLSRDPAEQAPEAPADPVVPPAGPPRWMVMGWLGAALVGTVLLLVPVVGVGPDWLDGVGAVVVATCLAWLLAARTGARALVASMLTLALASLSLAAGGEVLPTGAAVMTCALGGVYAVMVTVPASSYPAVVREVLVAALVAVVSGMAAVGFQPTVDIERFDMASLLIALLFSLGVIYRLGAGLHGIGRRGLVVVAVGLGVLVATLAYAEVLERYGAQGVVSSVLDFVDWTEARIGAFPRPLVALLGIPALAWGVHMRTRRRQGWWVCAFGVAATVPLAGALVDPDGTFLEAALRAAYSLVIGLPLGWLVIKADEVLTRPRGRRLAEEPEPLRPEPARVEEL